MELVIGIVILLVWSVILAAIISSATKTDAKVMIEKDQLKLLILLALKMGYSREEIDSNLSVKSLKSGYKKPK